MNYKTLLLGVFFIMAGTYTSYVLISPAIQKSSESNLSNTTDERMISPESGYVETNEDTVLDNSIPEKSMEVDQKEIGSVIDKKGEVVTVVNEQVVVEDPITKEVLVEVVAETSSFYSLSEISNHTTETNCWTTVSGLVYDLTPYIKKHPGGKNNIMRICGIDGTKAFENQHGGQNKPENVLAGFEIGLLK